MYLLTDEFIFYKICYVMLTVNLNFLILKPMQSCDLPLSQLFTTVLIENSDG